MTRASEHIYCGNNESDLDLKANGGDKEFGTHQQCFRRGYALGINQRITNMQHFLKRWGNAYKPHIIQHLYHGDADNIPPGYQRATLGQALQRGFALGSIALARRERGHSHERARSS